MQWRKLFSSIDCLEGIVCHPLKELTLDGFVLTKLFGLEGPESLQSDCFCLEGLN